MTETERAPTGWRVRNEDGSDVMLFPTEAEAIEEFRRRWNKWLVDGQDHKFRAPVWEPAGSNGAQGG